MPRRTTSSLSLNKGARGSTAHGSTAVTAVGRRYAWEDFDDAALLKLRFRDLRLRIENSLVWPDIERLYAELARRGVRSKPHFWFSTDWFSPDGVPGIAVPFFTGHPRLRRLERRMVGDVDGGNRTCRMRILRHEAGHALDTAYGLRRRADWRRVFGHASKPYVSNYSVRPRSRRYVVHLGHWYAQSHPTEDFAETFAVWLQPRARWRADYAGWAALEKLEFVDALMQELAASKPHIRNRAIISPLAQNNRTLGEHYRRKVRVGPEHELRYDDWLQRLFAPRAARPSGVRAGTYLREIEQPLRRALARKTQAHSYVVEQVMTALRQRARELDLVLRGSRREYNSRVIRLHERAIADVLERNREHYVL